MDNIHQIPVPERFLPLINRTLADAYEAESSTETYGGNDSVVTPQMSSKEELGEAWVEEEASRAYRESTMAQRAALDYLADPERAGKWVNSLDLGRAVYPNDGNAEAENKLYGVLGAMGRRFHSKYRKTKWFFNVDRERNPDGSSGSMIYCMPDKEATWVRKASGRE